MTILIREKKSMAARLLTILALLFVFSFQGCDLTHRRDPKDVPGQHNSSRWKVETNGTANYAAYVTPNELPSGTKIKFQVVKEGAPASLRLVEWSSSGETLLREWNNQQVADGQVEEIILPRPMRLGIDVGGVNFWRQATGSDARGDLDEVRFEGGWVLKVKLIPKEL
jgi:hypothetical protein